MADLTPPPIRTALINNPDGSPFQQANGSQGQLSTEKSWYYYWNNAGRQINANTLTLSQLVTHGTHADRPDPSTVVDGALYVEHDRGVLYQNWNGSWRYIAGTMYGSLSPDQRPTDLGLADGGFEFRSVDSNTAYAPKHFVWSQTAWIDATQVLYGTHATRPVADYHTPARTLYVETDRGSVIYQNQANVWTYCGGSMSNVLSARPADLGSADVGFVFIATDTAQSFRWNGAAWIETTGFLDPTTTLGDLLVRGAAVVQRLGKGTNGQVLTANAAAPLGVDWEVPPGGSGSTSGVISAFGRIGNVVGATGDYTVAQVTGAVANTRQVLAGAGMTGGGALSADVTLAAKAMVASGASHAAGIVPDPGLTAGTTHYLREDATWVVPPAGVGGSASLTHPNVVTKVDATSGQIVEGGITDLSAGNSGKVTILASGNVGIGTAAPGTPLDCAGMIRTTAGVSPTSGAGLEMSYQGGTCYLLGYDRTGGTYKQVTVLGLGISLGANGSPIALQGGNVQIGSTSPVSPLHVTGAAGAPSISATAQIVTIQAGTGGNGQVLEIGSQNASPWGTWMQGSYAGNLGFASPLLLQPAGGNVGIGIANPTYLLQLGTDSAGKPGTSTWSVVSDLKLKQNVEPVKDDSLAILGKLDWVRYEYNGKANTPPGLKAIGLVAQELQEQLPEAVRSNKTKLNETDAEETDVLAIDYHHILVHSARAIAQLNAEVQALKALIGKP